MANPIGKYNKLLWDFNIQTDKLLEHRRPDIVVIDKEKKECILIGLAVPGDQISLPKSKKRSQNTKTWV